MGLGVWVGVLTLRRAFYPARGGLFTEPFTRLEGDRNVEAFTRLGGNDHRLGSDWAIYPAQGNDQRLGQIGFLAQLGGVIESERISFLGFLPAPGATFHTQK